MLRNLFGPTIDKNKLTKISLDDLKTNVDPNKNYYAELKTENLLAETNEEEKRIQNWNKKAKNSLTQLKYTGVIKVKVFECDPKYDTDNVQLINILPLTYNDNVLITSKDSLYSGYFKTLHECNKPNSIHIYKQE
jgi:hypothetical protein